MKKMRSRIIEIWVVLILFASCANEKKSNFKITENGDTLVSEINSRNQKVIYQINNRQKNGIFTVFYSNDTICERGFYVNNTKEGVNKFFDKSGKLTRVVYLEHGKTRFVLNPKDYDFKRINLTKAPLSILVPKKWHVVIDTVHSSPILLQVARDSREFSFLTNMSIVFQKTNAPQKEVVEQSIGSIKQRLNNSKLLAKSEFFLDKRKGYFFNYMGNLEADISIQGISSYIFDGDIVYSITCLGSDKNGTFLKYADVFSEIIQSIRFN